MLASQSENQTQTFKLTDKQRELRAFASTDVKNLLIYGGSRSGKTFFIIYAIVTRALMAPKSRHAIFRKHGVSVKQSIGKDTLPKVMELVYPDMPFKWHEQDGYFSFPNGSEIWLAGLDDKERVDKVLGKEYASLYFNEASEINLTSYTVAQTRLAQNIKKIDGRQLALKNYVDLNPTTRAHWTYRIWIDGINPDGDTAVDMGNYGYMTVNPRDNTENLLPDYLLSLSQMSDRQKARFYYGEFTADVENALWRRRYIKRVQLEALPDMRRVIVAIDPAVSSEPGSDETGIICMGLGIDGYGYVLADDSGKFRPEEWAKRAKSLYYQFEADRIIAEVNQGGDMVETVLKAQGTRLPFKAVRATRGKVVRAEPIAALYERGKVFHAGEFKDLEDQMCFVAGTMVSTIKGPRRIETIKRGDLVLTRNGFAPVKSAGETGRASKFVVIKTTDKRTITCTPNHPIYLPSEKRFASAESVRVGQSLQGKPRHHDLLLGVAIGIAKCATATGETVKSAFCIGKFGKRTKGLSRGGIISTTSTTTPPIINWATLKRSRPRIMFPSTPKGALLTSPTRNGFRMPSNHGSVGSCTGASVQIAVRLGKRHTQTSESFAAKIAHASIGLSKRLHNGFASIAGKITSRVTQDESIAVQDVTMQHTASESVYNISVDDGYLPEFYANGILVHNCAFTTDFDRKAQGYSPDRVDALVWGFTELFPKLIKKVDFRQSRPQPKERFFA